jgi:hypothetical protein
MRRLLLAAAARRGPEAAPLAQLVVGLVARDRRLDGPPRSAGGTGSKLTDTDRDASTPSSSGLRNSGPIGRRGHCAIQSARWMAPSVR